MADLRYAVVLDFEATCTADGAPDPQEVIELPSVLVDLQERRVLDAFASFVRPVHHPQLDPFCTQLTSIVQADVDAADPFPAVFARHQAWLDAHDLHVDNALIVTCGDWDLGRMLPRQLRTSGLADVPRIYTRWLNVKVPFTRAHGLQRVGMKGMLETLGLPLLGRHHRGIDDCHNIARLLLALDTSLEPSQAWKTKSWPPLPLVLVHDDDTHPVVLERRTLDGLRGLASQCFHRRVARFVVPSGTLDESALFDLPAHTRVAVELRG